MAMQLLVVIAAALALVPSAGFHIPPQGRGSSKSASDSKESAAVAAVAATKKDDRSLTSVSSSKDSASHAAVTAAKKHGSSRKPSTSSTSKSGPPEPIVEAPPTKYGRLFGPKARAARKQARAARKRSSANAAMAAHPSPSSLSVAFGAVASMAVSVVAYLLFRRLCGADSEEDPVTEEALKNKDAEGKDSYWNEVIELLKLTWPLMLGNTLEWYEYGIYGYTATQISDNFFRGSAVSTWLGYAITFVARPFGGLVLGWVADNLGRTLSVQISLFGMLIATVGQGLLPGHYWGKELEGFGLVVLIIFRALQGLSAGGEIGAISSYMIETASLRTLGFATMLISFGGSAAFGMAAAVVGIVNEYTTPEEMLVWGWRIPFVISAVPGVIALMGRANIHETDEFLADAEANANEEREQFRDVLSRWRSLLVGGFATIGIGTMWYVGPIWTVSSLLEPTLGPSTSLAIASSSQMIALLIQPAIGWVCDKKGIAWVTLAGNTMIAVVSLPVWNLLASNPANETFAWIGVTYVYGVTQAVAGATIYLFSAELFPTHLRTIGLGMSYNLAVSYFGGLGPVLCEVLKGYAPLFGPGMWMSTCGLVSVAAVLWGLRLGDQGVIKLTHRRVKPYFGSEYAKNGELILEEASRK